MGQPLRAEFPVSLNNQVGFTSRLLYSSMHSPLPRRVYPSENWLSSGCLTSVIVRELVFPSLFVLVVGNSCKKVETVDHLVSHKCLVDVSEQQKVWGSTDFEDLKLLKGIEKILLIIY